MLRVKLKKTANTSFEVFVLLNQTQFITFADPSLRRTVFRTLISCSRCSDSSIRLPFWGGIMEAFAMS